MFTVLDPLLEFTYHLLFSWRKFALCIQSLLCMLFLFGWPPCQRSDMILMEVSQHAYDMIHYISGLFGYFSVCAIYVNLIWYLYLFMLNKFCLSLSLPVASWAEYKADGGVMDGGRTHESKIVLCFIWGTGLRLSIKTVFPRYGDSHFKYKTVMRLSYL